VNLDVQFLTMAAMIGCGAALGLLFDGYRVVWGELRLPRRLYAPFDLLYWALATAAVYRVLYLANGGEVRLYVLLALLLGVSAYFALLSGLSLRIMRRIVLLVKTLFRFLRRLAVILVVRPLIGLYRLLAAIFGFFATVSIFLGKLVIQLLYPVWKLTSRLARSLWGALFRAVRGLFRRRSGEPPREEDTHLDGEAHRNAGTSRISQFLHRIGIRRKR